LLATEHTQSLSEFRKTAAATIDRLNKTGDAEIITVNGEARAVLMSPAVYDELAKEAELSRDVAAIQRAMREFDEGKGVEAKTFFADLRSELLAKKDATK
jgi:prevent-host-death family protein